MPQFQIPSKRRHESVRYRNRPHEAQTSAEIRLRKTLDVPGVATVKLSARETVLLEHLARHADTTVSRSEIAGLFGDTEPDPESRRLDAAVGRLRAKLKVEGLDLPLQVVHAVGLRFVGAISIV